jgi:8-oxo-dGTP pyrophosphatase MutT (NUDIX family)
VNEAVRDGVPVRDAASVILVRRTGGAPQILMGQRGAAAVFMPDKFVFPGGAVEPGDVARGGGAPVDAPTARALEVDCPPEVARALPLTAVRELWEETGLRLGVPDAAAAAAEAPAAWRGFLTAGLRPRTEALRFVFRAITPPGRPRRFDARFFLAEAEALADDPAQIASGDGELMHLQWIDLAAARALPTPFITGIVLCEIEATLAEPDAARPAPYFRHDEHGSHFRLIERA